MSSYISVSLHRKDLVLVWVKKHRNERKYVLYQYKNLCKVFEGFLKVVEKKCRIIGRNLLSGDITTPECLFSPISDNQPLVTSREQVGDISRTPESISSDTTGSQITRTKW